MTAKMNFIMLVSEVSLGHQFVTNMVLDSKIDGLFQAWEQHALAASCDTSVPLIDDTMVREKRDVSTIIHWKLKFRPFFGS